MNYIFIAAVIAVVIVLILKSVRMVPQAHNWVVETFGKFAKTLKPGLNLINPFFSKVAYKIDIRERVLDMPAQGIITSDNASVRVDAVVFYKVMDPYKSSYGIENLHLAIINLGMTSLRSLMGKMTLDETFSSREKINIELLHILDQATDSWGTKITRVEIKDIQPPEELVRIMGLQKKAEQERRATVLVADAKKEAANREAEARERLAMAEANAIKMVADSLKSTGGDPLTYLLGQEYIKGMIKLGESNNTKFFLFPTDLMRTIKGLFNNKE